MACASMRPNAVNSLVGARLGLQMKRDALLFCRNFVPDFAALKVGGRGNN